MAESLSLNSWLVQSERSMHLRCPPGLTVTPDEYLNALSETARELELPLQLETIDVTWVDANLQQQRIRAKLTTPEPFGLLTGLEYVGRVAFVEQKTYLTLPVLPTPKAPDYTLAAIIGGGPGARVDPDGSGGYCILPGLSGVSGRHWSCGGDGQQRI